MNAESRLERPPILPLTSLRFFAAVGVVLYHLLPRTGQTPRVILNFLSMAGPVAVSFFFVLSGFILVYADVSDDGEMRKSRKAFWWARFGRIYPVYFLAFLVAGPPTYWGLVKHGTSGALVRMVLYGISASALVQAWSPFTAGSWNAPGWSLSAEAFFYAMFPWLVSMSRRTNHSLVRILVSCWLFASVPLIILQLRYHGTVHIPELVSKACNDTPLLRLPEFAVGMILGFMWMRNRKKQAMFDPKSPWPLSVLLGIIITYFSFGPDYLYRLVLLPLFFLLIFRCAKDHSIVSRCLSHPVLVRLGEASYALYILHLPLVVYWYRLLHRSELSNQFTLIYLVLIVGVSVGVYTWIERPMAKWVRSRFTKIVHNPAESRDKAASRI